MFYEHAIFIGRFQPFHIGHLYNIKYALNCAKKLIICVGSINRACSLKNPFTFQERKLMMESDLKIANIENGLFKILPLEDSFGSVPQWINIVKRKIFNKLNEAQDIIVIGHNKDESSFYLKSFPYWEYIEVGNYKKLNSSDFRKIFFKYRIVDKKYLISQEKTKGSHFFLKKFTSTKRFCSLSRKYHNSTK